MYGPIKSSLHSICSRELFPLVVCLWSRSSTTPFSFHAYDETISDISRCWASCPVSLHRVRAHFHSRNPQHDLPRTKSRLPRPFRRPSSSLVLIRLLRQRWLYRSSRMGRLRILGSLLQRWTPMRRRGQRMTSRDSSGRSRAETYCLGQGYCTEFDVVPAVYTAVSSCA